MPTLTTYLQDITFLYVLKVCVEISQDISSRHMIFQDIPSTHIFLNAHFHDISSRHIMLQDIPSTHIFLNAHLHDIPSRSSASGHIFTTYNTGLSLKPQDIPSRHTICLEGHTILSHDIHARHMHMS